jgi:GTP-binding protein
VLSAATRQGVPEALRALMARMDEAAAEAPAPAGSWQP